MTDYISREVAISATKKMLRESDMPFEWQNGVVDCLRILEQSPGSDVREVVLCKNCKHNMANIVDIQDGININENWNACQLTEMYDDVKPEDFCSRGADMREEQT